MDPLCFLSGLGFASQVRLGSGVSRAKAALGTVTRMKVTLRSLYTTRGHSEGHLAISITATATVRFDLSAHNFKNGSSDGNFVPICAKKTLAFGI